MKNKLKKGQTIYWLSLTSNYLGDCLPIVSQNLPRVHTGKVVKDGPYRIGLRSPLIVEAFINEDFHKNFAGTFSNLKLLPKPKTTLAIQAAQFGLHPDTVFTSMDQVKLKLVEFIMKDFDSELI